MLVNNLVCIAWPDDKHVHVAQQKAFNLVNHGNCNTLWNKLLAKPTIGGNHQGMARTIRARTGYVMTRLYIVTGKAVADNQLVGGQTICSSSLQVAQAAGLGSELRLHNAAQRRRHTYLHFELVSLINKVNHRENE